MYDLEEKMKGANINWQQILVKIRKMDLLKISFLEEIRK